MLIHHKKQKRKRNKTPDNDEQVHTSDFRRLVRYLDLCYIFTNVHEER